MAKYGRRYYDKFCRICVEPRQSVLFFQGRCLPCWLKTLLRKDVLKLLKR